MLSTKELIELHRSLSPPHTWTLRSFLPERVMRGKGEAAPAQRRILEAVVAAALLVRERTDDPHLLGQWEWGPERALGNYRAPYWAPQVAATDVSTLLEAAADFDPIRFQETIAAHRAASRVWPPPPAGAEPDGEPVVALWPARRR
jgi:hypothetical protein